jgi:hypothetical protein
MLGRYDRFEIANVICVTLGDSPEPGMGFWPSRQSVAAAPIGGQQIGQMAV